MEIIEITGFQPLVSMNGSPDKCTFATENELSGVSPAAAMSGNSLTFRCGISSRHTSGQIDVAPKSSDGMWLRGLSVSFDVKGQYEYAAAAGPLSMAQGLAETAIGVILTSAGKEKLYLDRHTTQRGSPGNTTDPTTSQAYHDSKTYSVSAPYSATLEIPLDSGLLSGKVIQLQAFYLASALGDLNIPGGGWGGGRAELNVTSAKVHLLYSSTPPAGN